MDWKDALKGLQINGDAETTNETPQPENDVKTEKALQKTPLHIATERKGRGGKTATIVYGFECDDTELKGIEKQLKQRAGIGGSSRCGEILLQGDCREKVVALLKDMGYKVK